jgi:hypothetical protein
MSHWVTRIKLLLRPIASQKERDVAYLNQATDIYDVERRMQEIDKRQRQPFWPAPAFQLSGRS